MNSTAANILITAQAAQAVATLNRVQAQLRSLSVTNAAAAAKSNGPWFTSLAGATGKLNATEASLKRLQASTVSANSASNRPWFASMTAAGSRMQWIGRQLTTNLTIPILAAAGAGLKWGLDFEKGMTRVKKVYGDGSMSAKQLAAETDALGRSFVAMSDKYAVSADEVANVAADWAAAGSSGVALAKQTDLTMQTMILGEMDAAEATKSLIAIQAQWGLSTEGLSATLRELNAVENETGTTLSDLVVGFSRASASAQTVGLKTGELAAMIAALVPAAGSASEAGNSLKTIFARMMKPTKDFTAVMGAMGIQTEDTAWQSLNAGQRLKFMADKFKTLTAPQRAVVSSLAAGNWQINRFQQLMKEMGSSTGYYAKTLALLENKNRVAQIAQQELNKVLESSPQRAKQAGIIIQNSLMKAMEPLIPVIIQVALWFGKLFRAFSEISPTIRSTITMVLLLLAALGPLVVMAGLVKLSIGQLAPIFIAVGRAMLFPLAPLKLLTIGFWANIVRSRLVVGAMLSLISVMKLVAVSIAFTAAVSMPIWKGMMLGMVAAVANASKIIAAFRAIGVAVLWMLGMVTFTTSTVPPLVARMATLLMTIPPMITAAFATFRTAMVATFAFMATLPRLLGAIALSVLGVHRGMWAAMIATQRAWSVASTALTAAWALVTKGIFTAAVFACTNLMGAFGRTLLTIWMFTATSLLRKVALTWGAIVTLFNTGIKGTLMAMVKWGSRLLSVLVSPWAIAIGAVVGLIVLFRKQIVQAFNNVVAYFRNLPAGVAKGLSPIANLFASIKGVILRAFNALPAGVKNALLAVVRIVHAAAMKIYELFSYINPFAHHSPSLVENVTNGMAAVNAQFENSAKQAESSIDRMHKAVNSLQGLSAGLTTENKNADYAEVKSNASKAGVGNAMPAYDKLAAEVGRSKAELDAMNKSIESQELRLKAIQDGVKAYDAALEKMNSELETTKAIQDMVSQSLDSAKERYDRFANAQIQGTQAAEDAIFSNTMAQKKLQLQIAKMEQESGTIDSVTDSYSKLQGEIETLTAKQTELRKAGAGSDVLGTYDKMIADLKKQQGGLVSGSADSPAAKIAALKTSLEALQKQADIMDLEKSLKFDSLNRNIEKFKNNVEELPYGQIMSGMDSSRTSVMSLQRSYDQLGTVMDGQNARIAQTQASRDALQKTYDSESEKLQKVKDVYQNLEDSIRSGEQALTDFASAAEEAVRRQEEAAQAAEKLGKKTTKSGGKGGSGGSGGDGEGGGAGLAAFEDAGEGDFATFGGGDVISREGGAGDQSGQIDDFTKSITDGLEESLGGLNPFAPLMQAWEKTKAWFSQNVAPLGTPIKDMFVGIGNSIGSAFSSDNDGKVGAFGTAISNVWNTIKGFWNALKTVGSLIGGLFGPDLMTTIKDLGKGFVDIWGQIVDPLRDLGNELIQFLKPAFEILVPVIGLVVAALEVVWEVINGAIGPVFNWLGGIIRALIQIITGVVRIITGVLNVIVGTIKIIIGAIKGIFTGDWSTLIDGLKQVFVDGFGKMAKGIWNIIQGIWTAIWSTIKNFAKLIWNTIWGFIKGVIDFFTHLWDVLVGHSIVPDMINAIIDWFLKLPGRVLGMIASFISSVIAFFATLPMKILAGLVNLGQMIWTGLKAAFDWVVQNGPNLLMGVISFFTGIPTSLLSALGNIGSKLWDWIKGGWDWIVTNGGTLVQPVIDYFKEFPGNLVRGMGIWGDKIGGWFKSGWDWIVTNGGNLIQPVIDYIKSFPENFIRGLGIWGDKIGGWFRSGWDWIVQNGGDILKGFLGFITGIPGSILSKLGNGAEMLVGYGKDMIQGLLNGAESLVKNIGNWFLDKLPGWIKTPFKKALGIASPSKVFYGYGQNIGQGLVNGVGDMQKQVEASSVAIAKAADKGEVGGMAISAVADTSSVGGSVSQLTAAMPSTAITAPLKADAGTVEDPMADLDLDAALAEVQAFVTSANAQLNTFTVAVGAAFSTITTTAQSAFSNMSTIAVSTFTAMQTSVVTIVTTMVTTVNGQLQLLIQYVTAFGTSFTAAWNEAWNLISQISTQGADKGITEWQRMADGMRSTFDNTIKPVFDDMKTMLTELEDAYSTTVDNIGTTWENVETKTKKPAGVVVNEVYNKGLRGAWNKFNDFLGIEALPEFTVPYATGGAVWGPGTGTSDSVNAKLSRGEHVITAKEVQGAGGHAAVMAQRKMWASSGSAALPPSGMSNLPYAEKFANGGPVGNLPIDSPNGSHITTPIQQAMWNAAKTAFPNVQLFSGTRTEQVLGHPDYHNMGMALDLSPMPELARWIYAMNSKTPVLELIHWPLQGWQNLKNGAPLDYGAGTNSEHVDHVHWAMNVMVGNDGKIISMAAGGSSGGAPIDYSKIIEDSFKQDMDAVRADLPKIPGKIGEWPKIAADVAQKKAVEYLKPLAQKMSISSGSTASAWAGAPDASVVEKVKAAMKPYGWDTGPEWEALNQLIGHESSWNPTAKNPSSTAYGLFQFLDTTWATVGGQMTSDPYQQAVYGGRYIKNRYQTPSGAWSFWQAQSPHWYDAGGYLQQGTQLVHNQTGSPEPVLTTAQWNAMYHLAGTANTLTPEDVQDAVEQANIATGNTDDATTAAIIKGMDTWSSAWTPVIVDSTEEAKDASEAVTQAAGAQTASTVLLSKSLGKYDTQIAALSKALTAFSNSAQQSVKVTVDVKTGQTTTTQNSSVNGSKITVEQPTFEAWAPTINAVADLIDALPYAERNWQADNPVAGETEAQRKQRIAANNLTNFSKGMYNVIKDVGPVALKHTAIIGTAAERLMKEDGPAWSAALTAIASNNPAGYAVAVLLVLKEVATILPLILNAILDIVPALIRAIVRFLTQFMPDSVYAYADMAAAEAAVTEQQEGGSTAMGQGQRYPTDAMSSSNGNENINLYMYGDLVMPNVSDGSDASDFVDQLKLLASN